MIQSKSKSLKRIIAFSVLMFTFFLASEACAGTSDFLNRTFIIAYIPHSDAISGGAVVKDRFYISGGGVIFAYDNSCGNTGSMGRVGETMESHYHCIVPSGNSTKTVDVTSKTSGKVDGDVITIIDDQAWLLDGQHLRNVRETSFRIDRGRCTALKIEGHGFAKYSNIPISCQVRMGR
jgi:hypothetical protein